MYMEETLHRYLDDLASALPAPGGGSTAALSGAMGAALASMVRVIAHYKRCIC